jgi:Ser/Thr protein kinase RdoA (MazF antagonist)
VRVRNVKLSGVEAFAALSRRRQLSGLRRLGRRALARYGLEDAALALQRDEHNTTFRVDAPDGRYLLRISRPGVHTADTVGSEMAWLGALRRDTDVRVPEPVAAHDGSFVVVASDPRVPEPRICVLLHWLEGRFTDRRLAPTHLGRVGALTAQLQEHGAAWTPGSEFLRPRVDTLTDAAKADSMAPSAVPVGDADQPMAEDGNRALELVETLVSHGHATLVARALEVVRASTRDLATETGAFGLVHGDLHYENVLFHRGEAGAIDFDDCGWGFHLYDLAVTLSELEGRPRYDELRNALLSAYAQRRALPEDHAIHLSALVVLRRMQILLWVLQSRDAPGFRDKWQRWARSELDALDRDPRLASG